MGSSLQPYSSAPQAPRIAADPRRSTRPHPREGSGDSITCQNAETRAKAKWRSLMTTFSHRLVPVVSVTRSSSAVLADLRRHSDTCTSASNTIQILCRSSEMVQPCSQSKRRRGRGEPTKPSPGQFPGAPVPALSIQHPTPAHASPTSLPMGPGTWAVSDPHQHHLPRRTGLSRLNF